MRWTAIIAMQLVFGRGRAISAITTDGELVRRLKSRATQHYHAIAKHHKTSSDLFIHSLMTALVQHEEEPAQSQSFRSALSVLEALQAFPVEEAVQAVYNAVIIARSLEAHASQISTERDIVSLVLDLHAEGQLIELPEDRQRLHHEDVQQELPGALLFRLTLSLAERDAFRAYLRRGAAPGISADSIKRAAQVRPVPRTWEREAALKTSL